MKNSSFYVFCTALCMAAPLSAQVHIVKSGKPQGRIVAAGAARDQEAARMLQKCIHRISGATLPVTFHDTSANPDSVIKEKTRKGDILIGNAHFCPSDLQGEQGKLKEDGFLLATSDNRFYIRSGGDKGSIYGAVTLLERYFGMDYWGADEFSYHEDDNLTIPDIRVVENPAFRYRQSQNYRMAGDTLYRYWYRLEEPAELFAGNYWVHTFDRLLPSARYGKEHPEYYSFFKGKRHPGKASQWCLTNPEVLEIVSQRVDSIFRANPNQRMISVSQNDGNYTNCTCDDCRAIDEREGAFSGSLIHFINQLADRFPDKQFSTLAYLYTMKAPRTIKPRPNVSVMLCDIDCDREVSLTENASGREFMQALEAWGKITRNLFVWDYGINFDNYLAPFPNFHILQDNIRSFRKNNTTMHFSQIAGSKGGDFAELRTYMVSKLMWNPDYDSDSLKTHFLNRYYGDAAPFLCRYLQTLEGALLGSGQRLWIYDSPVSHKDGMLRPALRKRYNEWFDEAEAAVAGDPLLLQRVRQARLQLQFSELEIARTESEKDYEDIASKLNLFEERVKEYGIPTLNERANSPVDYCALYRTRYMPRAEKNLASGASITFLDQPGDRYRSMAEKALTDDLFGGATFVESWVGWEGQDASLVIDLGEEREIRSVETDFLHQLGAWILLPRAVRYSLSTDGENFTEWENHDLAEDRSVSVKFVGVKSESKQPVKTRYVRLDITGTKVCPEWHYGVGHPCWFFMDEITIR